MIDVSESAHEKPPSKPNNNNIITTQVPREKPKPKQPSKIDVSPNPQVGEPLPTPTITNHIKIEELSQTPSNSASNYYVGKAIKKPTKTKTKDNFIKLNPPGESEEDDNEEDDNEEMQSIELKNRDDNSSSSSSDDEEKHKKKKKTKKTPSVDITETVEQISTTVNDTVNAVTKTAIAGVIKHVVKSKQFNIVLVIGTVTVCLGYLLKIIFWC